MNKILIISLMVVSTLQCHAQELTFNSLSTSLIRFEKNSQSLNGNFNFKFISGIEYQRNYEHWNFGIKYEHGLNKINDDAVGGIDYFYGTGYLREDNAYLNVSYNLAKFFKAKMIINVGLSLYYSNLNYSGQFEGGLSGIGTRVDKTYNTFGLAPTLSVNYYPIERLFISLNTNTRYGISNEYNAGNNQNHKTNEFVINAPELRIGVKF